MKGFSFVAVVATSLLTSSASAQLADSVTGFSGTQGLNGWSYGYYQGTFNPSGFTLMTQYNVQPNLWEVQDGTYWTLIGATLQHGNGTITSGGRTPVEQWSVREWLSDYTGEVTISGHIAKADANSTSNGTEGHIFVGATDTYDQYVGGQDTTGYDFSFKASVVTGEKIDFALDPVNANDLGDLTTFTYQVSAAPEPAPFVLLGLGALALVLRRRS